MPRRTHRPSGDERSQVGDRTGMHRIHRETRAQFIKESLCEVRTLLNQFERCGALLGEEE